MALERQADIDVGYDYSFERRWGNFERFVWAAFTILIVAGILGFFGRGPLNRKTAQAADGVSVQYERVVRFKSPTIVRFSVPVSNGLAKIEADKNTLQKLGVERLVPQPTQNLGSEEAGVFRYQVATPDTNSVFVQILMEPSSIGPSISKYRINGQTDIRIKQFVIP